MNNTELTDLGNLAIDRCRAQIRRVIQLIDDDEESAAIMLAISLDVLAGAVSMLEQDGKRPHADAVGIALNNFARGLRDHHYLQPPEPKEDHGTR
jgi:hypothetical protein